MSNMGFIEALLSQKDESARLRLLAEYNAETVMRIVCAFLNNDGGWIVIGASEDGARTGVDVEAVVADIQRNTVQRIKPLPLVYIHAEDYLDGKVVLVTVMKGGLPPYSFDSSYYTMTGDQVVKPNTDEVNLLIRRSMTSSSSWEKSTCLDAEWEDLNVNLMHEVVCKGLERGRLDERNNTPEKLLGNLQLVDTPNVKNGAMALFGQETPRFLPQSRMRIQVMLGGKAASQYEDTVVMEGNLLELSKRASDYFLNRLPMVSEFHHKEWDRKDYSEYPQDVLDEAVTNALIHRDMSDTTGEVLVFIYADRIEIINPGTMPENLIKKKNVVLPHVSTPRNPLMAEIFYVDGKMEKTGRGLKLIHDQMNDLKRKLPEWECLDGRTKLTIYRTPNVVRLNARITEYIATKKVGGSFSKQDYLQYWNYKISDPTAKNDLQQMVNARFCRKDGSGPATRYVVLANN